MQNRPTFAHGFLLAVAIFLAVPTLISAQTPNPQRRITQAIDETKLTRLSGNTHPLARPQFDRGAAPSSLPMQRMLLVLKRSAQQESALDALLEQQQDASSPNYHKWLTPQQFGQEFGPSEQDIQTITSWLQSQGFQIDDVSNGRTVIEFSGNAGEVQAAFHTAIHKYSVSGQDHWANASDPEIPTALTPVVAGINTLHNFPRQAMHRIAGVFARSKATGAAQLVQPQLTGPCPGTSITCYAVGPADFAKIYGVPNLLNPPPAPAAPQNGNGITVAIVGRSNINLQDVQDFRSMFGLPPNDPTIILNGPDPGQVAGDETEADLDVEWAGAVAPSATIDFVVSQSTETSDGVDLSAEYIVDNNLAPILSESFGACEAALGAAGNQFYSQLWQQAAAQGVTVTISTGDNGAAGCDFSASFPSPAQDGLQVSGIASTPYNVAVGGTDFNDLNNHALYWNTTNDSTTLASAKGYIPETTWNDSCTNFETFALTGATTAEANCNSTSLNSFFVNTIAGSGGKSSCINGDGIKLGTCTQGYPKPAWQTGTGVPSDSRRDVPDVSLFAADGLNGSFYVICERDQTNGIPCSLSNFLGVGGTSASAPSFAGIMALVDQKSGPQGNANYVLYKLAGQGSNSCTSRASAASTCVFYDIPAMPPDSFVSPRGATTNWTTATTIAMPCATGSRNCTTSTTGHQYGVLSGYSAASGYDLATGLGSVNAANLVSKWAAFALTPSSTSLALTFNGSNQINITHGQSVNVAISVMPQSGSGTPTGNVSLIANTAPPTAPTEVTKQGVQGFSLDPNGSVAGTTNALPGGTYNVVAQYAGDGTFGSSTSSPASVTVNPEASKVQMAYELFDPTTGSITNPTATTAPFGTPSLLRVNVTSAAGDACPNNATGDTGCPTGNITLTDNGNSLDGGTFALNSEGYAEDQLIDLPGGTHNLAATYNGDNSFSAPTPNPTTQTLIITSAPTQTGVSASTYSTTTGTTVGLFANITAQHIFSQIAPTGTVTYLSGSTPVGSAPVSGNVSSAGHQATASANISTNSLPHGQDSITAQYSGDASYAASTSAPINIAVLYATDASLASSSNPVQHGTSVTFTAQITTSQTGAPPITGTVTFLSDGVQLGVINVTNGQAQLTTSTLPGGIHEIVVQYSGDSNYASANAFIAETVNLLNTTTSLTTSNSVITQGSTVTLTASVAPAQDGGPTLTGTVQFFYDFSAIGGDAIDIGSAVGLSNGQAQITSSALPANIQSVGAIYSGDSNYNGSAAQIPQTVNPAPTFTVAASPTTINIPAPGQSGSTTLTFTSQNALSGSATLTSAACSGLPFESSCSFSPATIDLAADGTATTTLTVMTTAPSVVVPLARNRWDVEGWKATGGGIALACLLFLGFVTVLFRGKQRRWGVALLFTSFLLLAVSVGCGGGGGSSGGGGGNPGTPVGSKVITVTVTINGVTQTLPLTVNVQ